MASLLGLLSSESGGPIWGEVLSLPSVAPIPPVASGPGTVEATPVFLSTKAPLVSTEVVVGTAIGLRAVAVALVAD